MVDVLVTSPLEPALDECVLGVVVVSGSLNGSGNFDSNNESKLLGSVAIASTVAWLTFVAELFWLLFAVLYCGVTATGACTGGKLA